MCPILGCDRSYSHPSSMRKHLKTHGAAAKGVPLPQRILEGSSQLNQQIHQVKISPPLSHYNNRSRESRASSTQHTSTISILHIHFSRWALLTQPAPALLLRFIPSRSTNTQPASSTLRQTLASPPRQTSRWVLQARPKINLLTGLLSSAS